MSAVRYAVKGRIARLTLARPEKLNAIDAATMDDLAAAWVRYRDDDGAWLAILTGEGRAFSAGADKSWFEKAALGQDALGEMQRLVAKDPFWSGALDKPVIAAVNGLAVGAAVDLVLRSDLRVAAESAFLLQAEVQRGNFMLFHDNMPSAMAAEMIAGFKIDARRAYEVGVFNRLSPDGKTLDAALEMADELLSRPRDALREALKLLRDLKYAGAVVPRALIDRYATTVSKSFVGSDAWKRATDDILKK